MGVLISGEGDAQHGLNWVKLVLQVVVELPSQFHLRQLEETIRVLEREQVELINVPVPEFDDGDPADIVHDFQRVRHTHT